MPKAGKTFQPAGLEKIWGGGGEFGGSWGDKKLIVNLEKRLLFR